MSEVLGFLVAIAIAFAVLVLTINYFDFILAGMDWLYGSIEACCKFRDSGF